MFIVSSTLAHCALNCPLPPPPLPPPSSCEGGWEWEDAEGCVPESVPEVHLPTGGPPGPLWPAGLRLWVPVVPVNSRQLQTTTNQGVCVWETHSLGINIADILQLSYYTVSTYIVIGHRTFSYFLLKNMYISLDSPELGVCIVNTYSFRSWFLYTHIATTLAPLLKRENLE